MKHKYEFTNNAEEIDEAPEIWQMGIFQHGDMIETVGNVGVGCRR